MTPAGWPPDPGGLLAPSPAVEQERRLLGGLPADLLGHPQLAALAFATGANTERRPYLTALTRNLRALEERSALCRMAQERGIPLMVIKGGYLCDTLYADPALRYLSDLDVWVPPSHVALMDLLLCERGYRAHPFLERLEHGVEHHLHYRHASGTAVEVHWALWHELDVDGEAQTLWARARPHRAADGTIVLGPSMTDHLMIVAVHAATHAFALGPAWLLDLALLALHPEVDRDAALAEAERRRGGLAVEVALGLAAKAWAGRQEIGARLERPLRRRARLIVDGLGEWLLRGGAGPVPASWLLRAALHERPAALLRSILSKLWVRFAERDRQVRIHDVAS